MFEAWKSTGVREKVDYICTTSFFIRDADALNSVIHGKGITIGYTHHDGFDHCLTTIASSSQRVYLCGKAIKKLMQCETQCDVS